MITGSSKIGAAAAVANESTHAINNPHNTGGAGEAGGYISQEKDAKESSTAPKFGDVYNQIQAKYGQKAEKAREIKKTLGKDDFLKIMLTQMKNQDPTNPFKAEQMATEIAQFTSVEQLQNVNQNLNKMSTQNRPLEQMAMTNLIGKVVTIDRERFPHAEGQSDDINFNLPRNAASVQVSVTNDVGEEVLQKDLGAQKAGAVSFLWDGKKTNTLPAKGGTYRIQVNAKDESGKEIDINPQVQTKVIGVSFEGTEPVFLVGDAHHQDKITMRNIVKIEVDNGQLSAQGPNSKNQQKAVAQPKNIISFQRGVGSSNGELELGMPGGMQGGPSANNPAGPTGSGAGVVPQDLEKGFPNGLKDSDELISKGGEIK